MIAGTCMYIYQRIPGLFGAFLWGVFWGGFGGFFFFLIFGLFAVGFFLTWELVVIELYLSRFSIKVAIVLGCKNYNALHCGNHIA